MAEQFQKLGYTLTYPENLTGFCTEVDTGREGPTLLIMGELDSIICPSHPESDPETGAVHSCGHNAQCAGLLGVAAALTEPGILDDLSGKILSIDGLGDGAYRIDSAKMQNGKAVITLDPEEIPRDVTAGKTFRFRPIVESPLK